VQALNLSKSDLAAIEAIFQRVLLPVTGTTPT
jgi:hypothetical protein